MPPRPTDPRRDPVRRGISDARAYTPRGRTVREAPELRQSTAGGRGSTTRPALHVLDGGRTGSGRVVAGGGATSAGPAARRVARTRTTAAPAPRRARPRPRRLPPLADPRRRLRVSTILALALFAVIGIRLVAFQVVEAPAYAGGGLQDRLSSPIALPAPRGAIYDRSGTALAHSVEARYVYADPGLVDDPVATADALSPLLGIARSELLPLLSPRHRSDGQPSRFEWLARGVDVNVAKRITGLNLAGIGVGRDERREVPGGDLAANLIGFTGTDLSGLEGLEAQYDEILRGVSGQRIVEIGKGDLATEIPGGYRQETPPKPGGSLQLTIDRDLQYEVQRMLSTAVRQHRGSTAAAIVLDVRTGEVLAQASHPTYDAASWQKSKSTDRNDAATSFVVDPGSVHKALVFAAALEEGVIRPDSTVVVSPTIEKGDTTFADTHPLPAGTRMTVPGILAYSSNVGTIKVAAALGPERLYDYQRLFGLGQSTNEGMPGEADGRLLEPNDWSGSSYGSVPIGHSVDVTPLQMAAAYAAIANDGTWVQPHLVREIIAPDGSRTPIRPPQTRKVISPANAAALRTMLEAVVTVEGATGTAAAIAGYRVAGKTGTGSRLVDGRYAPGEVGSFVGMAPADAPRYVIAVFVHSPGGGGGAVAAPAFRDMMAFTLRHYRVPPTGTKAPDFTVYR